jgi:SAM-dependent methyltransferase
MSGSSTQYDAIGEAYADMKRMPGALLERENLRAALSPHIRNATVLDLACGTGYYSRLLLEWGASRVVGVDISSAMVTAAQKASASKNIPPEKLTFLVGDAMKPLGQSIKDSGPFDIVLGAWLLNYAPSQEDMTSMFRNISSSLRPGGVFVGITPPPAQDLDAFAKSTDSDEARALAKKFGVRIDYLSPLENGQGYNTRVTGFTSPKEVTFENFHLRRQVYETAGGEAGGMSGPVKWPEVYIPGAEVVGYEREFWNGFFEIRHFGIMVVER